MRFTNLTRATEIGANSYLIEIGGKRVVVDAGMHPRREGEDAMPNFNVLPDRSVDAILLSHAHLDHIGSMPVLMRRQPHAPVFMTPATARLGEIILHNSVNVMSREQPVPIPGERAVRLPSFFTHRETDVASQVWREVPLGQPFSFDGERLPPGGDEREPSFEFFDAGHILGSTGVLIRAEGRRIFYTGDINLQDQTVSRAANFPGFGDREPLDVLIVETTRGDNPARTDRRAEEERFGHALRAAFDRGGAVLVPVFALGKTQEVLAVLLDFKKRGLLAQDAPIYIGGLSTKMTEVYDRFCRSNSGAPRQLPGLGLLDTVAPFVLAGREAADAPIKPGRVYALSSGMMTEHTLSNTYARRMMGDPKNAILFVGYADPESPAGRLRAASPGDRVRLNDEEDVPLEVRATVETFDFSAHADRESIRQYVLRAAPKKVVLVHGDPAAVGWFQKTLKTDRPEMEVLIPPPGEAIEL